MNYYNIKLDEVFKNLGCNENGLSSTDAAARLEKYGPNQLKEKKKISPLEILLSQFTDPLVIILIVAAFISAAVGYYEFLKEGGNLLSHFIEPGVISLILVINAILGFVQEYNAEKAIDALKKLASLKAVVIRDGKQMEIEAKDLVPGDIIKISEGEKIPADSRLVEAVELNAQEAALTGESVPVKKEISEYNGELSLGDQKNMVFSGTVITSGKGKAVVVKTGMETEIGKIATLIEEAEEGMTPLQKKLEHLGKLLSILTLVICVIVFATGLFRGKELLDMFIFSIALAVAAIPEGLPAVVTISLSMGVKRMIKRNALIRKLPSVETLGCTTVICSDKTGTLTHNQMTVRKAFVDNTVIDISGSGYEPSGEFSAKPKDLELLLRIGSLNNDARINKSDEGHSIIGDPTEGALIVSAEKHGIAKKEVDTSYPRLDELPFDSTRKMMTTLHKISGKNIAYIKGAPDLLLKNCSKVIENGKITKLTPAKKKAILEKNEEFANEALRVLGFAYKEIGKSKKSDWEKDLVFVGLQGMIDPPRQEVKEAIAKCKSAGIKVVMITGDYKGTAIAIANELGIEGKAVTGEELRGIDLDREVENISVYARVNPEDKMAIVTALQKKGHVAAMTGDGVNDAPALKQSDLGIAMGISGTDVAKEASDMILTDDNFASIVNAVEEGRRIYDNIRKFVVYLLSSNIGEIFVAFGSLLLGLPLPITVVQLLWINLVTDGVPATALSVEPGEKGIMTLKPRKSEANIVNKKIGITMFLIGIVMAFCTLGIFLYDLTLQGWTMDMPIDGAHLDNAPKWLQHAFIHASTMAFCTLMMLQMFNVLNARSQRKSLFSLGLLTNKFLWLAIGSSVALQLIVVYIPFLQGIFSTVALTLKEWAIVLGISSSVLLFGEIFKATGIRQE